MRLWREAHFEVNILKAPHVRTTFWCSDVVSRGRRKGLCTLSKVSKTWGFCGISKNDGRRGTFEEEHVHQSCWEVRGWFPEKGCILEHQISRFAEMILRDGCSTSDDLALIFSWQAHYFRQVEWKNRKTHWHEAVSSALNFPFLQEVSQIASFLTSSTFKNEEVSQNCFDIDVVKFKNWGGLAELFRFGCCQVQKLRKCRKIASFSSLQIDKQIDRQTDRQTDRQIDR